MFPQIKAQNVLNFCFILFILAACRTTAKTPSPTRQPTPTLAGTVPGLADIYGNWQPVLVGKDAMYLQFNSDGTCRQSYTLHGLDNAPDATCTYKLEGSNLVLADFAVVNLPPCTAKTGTYAVRMLAGDWIKLTAIEENCTPRRNSTAGEYNRVP